MSARRAIVADVPRIVELGAEMHAESRFRVFSYAPDKVQDTICDLIEKGHPVFVTGNPVHAFFIGMVQRQWFGEDLESFDLAFYVAPQFRGGTSAMRLLTAYLDEARRLGVADVQLGTSTGINVNGTARFFERAGFEQYGASFKYRSDHV